MMLAFLLRSGRAFHPLARNRLIVEDRLSPDDRILAAGTVCILLVKGESPDGIPIYAYVAVRADKLQDFMAAQADGTFYPEDFGVIIDAGEGEPSEAVRTMMSVEYGFNHESQFDIPDQAAARAVVTSLGDLPAT
jgi:hypothetical protein